MKEGILHGEIMNFREREMSVTAFLVSLKSHHHSISLHRGMALLWFFQSRHQKSARQRWSFLSRAHESRNLIPPAKKKLSKNIGHEGDDFRHLIQPQCLKSGKIHKHPCSHLLRGESSTLLAFSVIHSACDSPLIKTSGYSYRCFQTD